MICIDPSADNPKPGCVSNTIQAGRSNTRAAACAKDLGAFSHSARTAPIITVSYPGHTPENHPPTEACMIHSKQHRGAEFRTLGPVASIRLKQKIPWCTSRGCRVQNSGPWVPWLPAVENSRLLAQRGHSAQCALFACVHGTPDL